MSKLGYLTMDEIFEERYLDRVDEEDLFDDSLCDFDERFDTDDISGLDDAFEL